VEHVPPGRRSPAGLEETEHCEVRCRTKVTCILDLRVDSTDHNWEIQSGSGSYKVNFLVNAGGYQTREVEALLGLSTRVGSNLRLPTSPNGPTFPAPFRS
jgi:glycine/D-amino acid oxidase-like deaminating enzyme